MSTVYTFTCGGVHRAGASSVTAPAPVMVYIALAQAVSYAAQAQVLEYVAPAFSASAGPFATATGSSILSLSCPPSTLALVLEYIAPAPAVYAAPAPVMVYLALVQAVSYAAPAQVLDYLAPALVAFAAHIATTTSGFSPCSAYFYTCTCGAIHRANTSRVRCTCACHEYIAPAQQFLTPCQLKYLSTWRQRL